MNFTAIIPARYASTRFPGKPLALLAGKPVIQHVWERAAAVLPQVIVATDDERIAQAVRQFGGTAAMTDPNHRCGTERCAEVAADCDADVVINIQGDEPFVSEEQLRALMACFDDPQTDIATLRRPLPDADPAIDNPNCVKVVSDLRGFALYFSRSPIPYIRDKQHAAHRYAHVGLYAYRTRVLREIVKLEPSPLEQAESLEQLRWLENGYKIKVADCTVPGVGIDTPEDLEAAEQLIAAQQLDRSIEPKIHEIQARERVAPEVRKLENGITLNVFDKPDHELVKLTVLLPGGRAEFGHVLAAATARMLKDGCEGMTAEEVAETIDFNGAEISASVADHHCIVSLFVIRRSLEKVLPLFVRLLTTADYPETAVNAYKRNQIAQLQCEMQTPSFHSNRAVRRQVWGEDHPMYVNITAEALSELDSEKLRNCLHSMLVPDEMQAIMAGAADSEAVRMVSDALGSIHGDATARRIFRPMPEAAAPSADPEFIEVPGSLQYALSAWLPMVGVDHPDYWPLRLAVHMLGGYFGSRLMLNIREDKGYTYGIGAGAAVRPEGSVILIDCEFDPQYKDGVLKELRAELQRMGSEPADKEEFDRMRLNMAGALATMAETPEGQLGQLAQIKVAQLADDYYQRQWQALQQVTPQQVADVSARYLNPDNLHIVLAGDKK